jgi:hypothetical protein
MSEPERDEKGRLLPGHTANPNGRPKGISLVSILKEELQKTVLSDDEEIDYARKMIRDYMKEASENKDGVAIRDMMDRIDGKPLAKQEITGKDGEPITLKIEFDEPDDTD